MIVEALDVVQFSLDREHNFLSKKILTKLIPSLIYEAHELCKAIGKKLEMELRSMVVARLQDLRKSKLKVSDVEFAPVDTMSYVRKHASQWQRVQTMAAPDSTPGIDTELNPPFSPRPPDLQQ